MASLLTYKQTKDLVKTAFEVLGLSIAWEATLYGRPYLNSYFGTTFTSEQLRELAPPLSGLILLWLIAKVWLSSVRPKRQPQIGDGFTLLIEGVAAVSTLTILMTFFSRQLGAELSRSFVVLFVPTSLLAVFIARYAALLLIISVERRWPSPELVAVLGKGEEALCILDRLRDAEAPHFHVAGLILPEECTSDGIMSMAPVLGTTRTLAAVINSTGINRIILAKNSLTDFEADRCGVVTQRMGVVLSQTVCAPVAQLRIGFTDVEGLPLLNFSPVAFGRPFEAMKRVFDIVASAMMLIAFAPLMVVTALIVALTSKGPIFYRSTRVGKGGRHFRFLKFRSMYQCARPPRENCAGDYDGHIFKAKKDARITPFGRIMRRYSIDEIPQLLNVLKGDMSLVGPRPLPATDLDPDGQSQQFASWSEQRSKVLPGITGLWQIRGRSDLSFQEMMRLDLQYIQNWSLGFDLRILFETPVVVLTGRGAY